MNEIVIMNGTVATKSKVVGVKVYDVMEITTYELKERWVETDYLHGHEEIPQKRREQYLEITTKTQEIEQGV